MAPFASGLGISESEAYGYLCRYGAIDLCEKHYPIMHTLPLRDNIDPAQYNDDESETK